MNFIYNFDKYYYELFKNENIKITSSFEDIPEKSFVYSRKFLPNYFQKQNFCICGQKSKKRYEDMLDLMSFGVECMNWSLCETKEDVENLFDLWKTKYVISKINFNGNCKGVFVFTKDRIPKINYNKYIFCEPVNLSDGYVYKIECLYGMETISWVSQKESINCMGKNFILNIDESISKFKNYENRKIIDVPYYLKNQAEQFSIKQSDNENIGYISIDYMKDKNGNYICIEYNYTNVIDRWAKTLDIYGKKYKNAVMNLFENKNRF